jgi:hypothetical protein
LICTKRNSKYKKCRGNKNISQSGNSAEGFKQHAGWMERVGKELRNEPDIDEEEKEK